jgi:hypothetical protein
VTVTSEPAGRLGSPLTVSGVSAFALMNGVTQVKKSLPQSVLRLCANNSYLGLFDAQVSGKRVFPPSVRVCAGLPVCRAWFYHLMSLYTLVGICK